MLTKRDTSPQDLDAQTAQASSGNQQRLRVDLVLAAAAGLGLVGLALRAGRVLRTGLWSDEAFTIEVVGMARDEFYGFVTQSMDLHPPGYYLWLRTISFLTPGGPAPIEVLRFVTASTFVVSLAAVWLLMRRSPRSLIRFVACGAVLALSPAGIYLDAELRMYGMLTGAVLWTLVAAERYVRSSPMSLRAGVALGLLFSVLGMIHYAGLVIAAALGASILLSHGVVVVKGRRFAALGLTLAAVWLPYSPVLFGHLKKSSPYDVTASDAMGFLVLSLGVAGAVTVTAAVLSVVQKRSVSGGIEAELALPGFVIASLILSVVSFFFQRNILNVGIVSSVAALLVVAAARRIPVNSYHLAACGLMVGALAVPAAVVLPADQETFGPNRVSTVDVLDQVLAAAPYSGLDLGVGSVIIHVDWDPANAHFAMEANSRVPLAVVDVVSLRQSDPRRELLSIVGEHLDACSGSVLIVSRVIGGYRSALSAEFDGTELLRFAHVIDCRNSS